MMASTSPYSSAPAAVSTSSRSCRREPALAIGLCARECRLEVCGAACHLGRLDLQSTPGPGSRRPTAGAIARVRSARWTAARGAHVLPRQASSAPPCCSPLAPPGGGPSCRTHACYCPSRRSRLSRPGVRPGDPGGRGDQAAPQLRVDTRAAHRPIRSAGSRRHRARAGAHPAGALEYGLVDAIIDNAEGRTNDQISTHPRRLVYDRLLRERIIVLGRKWTTRWANRIVAQLLLLAAETRRPTSRCTQLAGRSVTAGRPSTTR